MDNLNTSLGSESTSRFICLQALASLPGLFVKQKFEKLEAVTGCETPNTYKVYPGDHEGNKASKHELFKCKEKSECIQRICLPGDCRAFEMKVKQLSDNRKDDDIEVMKFDRDYKCTFLCLNRPVLQVELKSHDSKQEIGRIVSPFFWCDRGVKIYGPNQELRYDIIANCCQLGFICPLPCEACQKIKFEIRSPSGEFLSEMWKVSAGCFQACISDADCFKISFPKNATPEDKALIMAATVFIDYRYFEKNKDNAIEVE